MKYNSLQKLFYNIFRGSARVLRARGDGGPLQAVAAPLTPRPRGTIYEALPFTLDALGFSYQFSPRTEAFICEEKIGNLLAGPWSSWL